MPHFFTRIRNFIQRQLLRSSRYRWHIFTPQISRETIEPIIGDYRLFAAGDVLMERNDDGTTRKVSRQQLAVNRSIAKKRVVYLCDGRTVAGGLADRFKGLLSLYALCLEAGYEFRICYTRPFRLADYLPPVDYDWRIEPEELHPDKAAMLVLENTEDSDYQTQKQVEWLRRRMAEGPAEMHVITNSNYAYSLDYAALFRQLFHPAPHLAAALEAERARLGHYVTVNARFLSMLGDFRETGDNSTLPEEEARNLTDRCLAELEKLHTQHPQHVLLVNSDSMRFLAEAQQLPYVRVVEGRVAHTDLMAHEGANDTHMKLLLDFFLISYADEIFLLHTPPMRISGFPYAASRLAGKEMRIIEF